MEKIIFDTDIGGDCDDTGALAILQQAVKQGKAKLLGVTLSTASPYAPGCSDAINRYYKNVLPIGQTKRPPPGEDTGFYDQSYGRHIHDVFDHAYKVGRGNVAEDAVRLLRRLLSQNEGDKITIVVVGSCINIAGLLDSGADDISPLTGKELMEKSVKQLSLMGCFFPTKEVPEVWFGDFKMEAECNIVVDIASAQTVFTKCPVPVVVSHYLIGYKIRTGGILIEKERENPVAESYFVHSHGDRESWDPISSYYAVCGFGDILTAEGRGVVTIDEKGVSTFVSDKDGKHILLGCPDFQKAKERLDGCMLGEF